MTELQPPVRELLAEKVDEDAIVRIWAGVNARRGGKRLGRPGSTRPAWFWGLAGATIGTLSMLLLLLLPERAKTASVADGALNGPLVSRAGRALAVLGGEPASKHELSDGSSIALSAGSRLEVLENTSKTFVSVLRSGHGSFSVRPSGPRRWTVEAGLATVEVVGTRFDVTRSGLGVEISVEHGVVLVRSELIQDRVQRLTAGQSLTIRAGEAPLPLANGDTSAGPVKPAPMASSAEHASAAPSLEQLLMRADERRRLGDVAGAESALRLALSAHGNEPQAALAAFTLGKLLSDVAGRPEAAAEAFAHCLALSPPSALAEDALYRLAETQANAGNASAARASAQNYRTRYPNGRHIDALSRWLSEH